MVNQQVQAEQVSTHSTKQSSELKLKKLEAKLDYYHEAAQREYNQGDFLNAASDYDSMANLTKDSKVMRMDFANAKWGQALALEAFAKSIKESLPQEALIRLKTAFTCANKALKAYKELKSRHDQHQCEALITSLNQQKAELEPVIKQESANALLFMFEATPAPAQCFEAKKSTPFNFKKEMIQTFNSEINTRSDNNLNAS